MTGDKPTENLRWLNGVLQQEWFIQVVNPEYTKHYAGHEEVPWPWFNGPKWIWSKEWRDVPSISTAEHGK